MRIGSFSVLIAEGYEHGTGHVGLRHGQVYTLRLGNHGSPRCDAQVTIDGKDMGLYRINGHDNLVLERNSQDKGRFTFFRAESVEARESGVLVVNTEDRGLVQVRFKPERMRRQDPYNPFKSRGPSGQSVGGCFDVEEKTSGGIGMVPQNMSAGITALTGQSDQQFVTVAGLDYDPNGEVVISLRLVEMEAVAQGPRELKPVSMANPVPRSV